MDFRFHILYNFIRVLSKVTRAILNNSSTDGLNLATNQRRSYFTSMKRYSSVDLLSWNEEDNDLVFFYFVDIASEVWSFNPHSELYCYPMKGVESSKGMWAENGTVAAINSMGIAAIDFPCFLSDISVRNNFTHVCRYL